MPEIAHLAWIRLEPDEDPLLVACDMRYGHVVALDPRLRNRQPPRLLARLRNPCRVEVCDLDGRGMDDLAVADPGSYRPKSLSWPPDWDASRMSGRPISMVTAIRT